MAEDTMEKLFALVDSVVELYLSHWIKPFLSLHETFYNALNSTLRKLLDDNKNKIPEWCTANFITYFRTVLVIPTVLLLAWNYALLPSVIVMLVDFGDFLDGVVARFWVDVQNEKELSLKSKDKKTSHTDRAAPSPTHSDDETFEVVTTGHPQTLPSWLVLHRNRTYGGFIDAVCDKAFVVPCWISLLHEVASACIRFRAYYTPVSVSAPKVEGFDFSTSAVKADHVGKAKQTFEMVGTALFIVPWARFFGTACLVLAVPLAYESVRRKVHQRVLYINSKVHTLDHKTLKFWMQAKALGSKLIIGFTDKNNTDMILNACACSCVDEVVAEAPEKLDLMFLEKQNVHYVLAPMGEPKFVTDEVINAGRCLEIGEDGVVRLFKLKDSTKKE